MDKQKLILGIAMLGLSSVVHAAGVAKVLLSIGESYVERAGKKILLHRGSEIFQGDKLVTGHKGNLQIRFTDNGLIAVRPNSVYIVNEYQFQSTDQKTGKYAATLAKGQLRALTGIIGKNNPQEYKLGTRLSTVGVAGTSYSLAEVPSGQVLAVWDGTAVLETTRSILEVGPSEAYSFAFVSAENLQPVGLTNEPAGFSEHTSEMEAEENETADEGETADDIVEEASDSEEMDEIAEDATEQQEIAEEEGAEEAGEIDEVEEAEEHAEEVATADGDGSITPVETPEPAVEDDA